jgi:hypothetical protein
MGGGGKIVLSDINAIFKVGFWGAFLPFRSFLFIARILSYILKNYSRGKLAFLYITLIRLPNPQFVF